MDRDALNGLKMMKKLTIKERKALDAFNAESRFQKKATKKFRSAAAEFLKINDEFSVLYP